MSMSMPMDKMDAEKNSKETMSIQMDTVQPNKKSNEVEMNSMPMDKVHPKNKCNDTGSVSILYKVQKDNRSNGHIEVHLKGTDETDNTDELFDDPTLDLFKYNLENDEYEWKHYYNDSDEMTNDMIPYDPKNENWHDDLSTLDGSEIAFNQQSLETRLNKLTDALTKNLSQPHSSTPESQKSSLFQSQRSSGNPKKDDYKDSGIGSIGSKQSIASSNNDQGIGDH